MSPQTKLREAIKAGKYMLALFTIEDGQITLFRKTEKFPIAEFEACVDLLRKDLLKTDKA